jgi:hypothetical protein
LLTLKIQSKERPLLDLAEAGKAESWAGWLPSLLRLCHKPWPDSRLSGGGELREGRRAGMVLQKLPLPPH